MDQPRRLSPPSSRSGGIAHALGLVATDDDAMIAARERELDDAQALWPVAVAATLIVPAVSTAMLVSTVTFAPLPFAIAALVAVAGLSIWAVLALPALRARAVHERIAAIAVAGAILAVALSLLVQGGAALPPTLRLTAFVGAYGAIAIVATALHPLRAASLGYAFGLAMMVPITAGLGLAAAMAALLASLLAIGMVRLAWHDLARTSQRADARAAADLAMRFVTEFETQGTGWFWQTDRQGNLTYLTDKVAQELKGHGIEAIGERLTAVFRVDSQLVETERTLTFHLSARTSFTEYSVVPAFAGAAERWWSISGRPMLDALGRFQGFIGSGSDLTERRRQDAEITRLALFDSLTGLANRQRMRLSLDQMLSPQQGTRGVTGLFLLDLDRFKAVNDTLGHQVGDELLKQVAIRLLRTVGDAGLVGRLGGDEFKVVIPREGSREKLGSLAREIIAALSQPYTIANTSITISCSIGVALAPEHGSDAETLVRNADLALYAAKADGRGVHRFFRDELLSGAQNRKQLEDDLRIALRENQFHLAYQPVVSTSEARIVGFEALLRWQHPTRGAISPADFVPVAEECGLIEPIGEWVLRTATSDAATWPDHVRVAVNVSPIQFANPQLPRIVTSAIAAAGLNAARLELEITESVFLNEDATTDQMFRALKGVGVRLALDDFGTGYSSLGYLKKAPFDKIKIDQSFVRGAIMAGNRNAAIIKAIVTLADTLGMETTAEGVEQQDEIALIRELGCSHIQGYVYGHPMAAADALTTLSAHGGLATAIGHKVSRAARTTLLRTARIEVGNDTGDVRIRNLSSGGAMIDGVDFPPEAVGVEVLIELLDGQLFPATIRWVGDGKAGLEFARAFDLERLVQAPVRPARRAAG